MEGVHGLLGFYTIIVAIRVDDIAIIIKDSDEDITMTEVQDQHDELKEVANK